MLSKVEMMESLDKAFTFELKKPNNNKIKIDANKLTEDNVGFYTVRVSVEIHRGPNMKTLVGRYRLEVLSAKKKTNIQEFIGDKEDYEYDVGQDIEAPTPETIIHLSEWDGLVVDDKQTQAEFSPEQPIPKIVDLSPDGLLKIRWDKTMHEIDVPEQLPQTVVLLRDLPKNLRNLQDREFYWLANASPDGQLSRVQIEKALDIRLLRPYSTEGDLSLPWEISEVSQKELKLQIYLSDEH